MLERNLQIFALGHRSKLEKTIDKRKIRRSEVLFECAKRCPKVTVVLKLGKRMSFDVHKPVQRHVSPVITNAH